MKTLPPIKPTSEQLPLILNSKPGAFLIRGAAGSGKTTTAILRLKQLSSTWLARRTRLQTNQPVRILVVTYNRTLRGYIANLAEEQVKARTNLEITVSTFARWSRDSLPGAKLLNDLSRRTYLSSLVAKLPLAMDFLLDEVDYMLGRFLPEDRASYLTSRRDGRGVSPRVDRELRQRILNEVIAPYEAWKQSESNCDWNDLAIRLIKYDKRPRYDIIIADESQDLSANQVRALLQCAAKPSSITFVLDAAQRIYPRGFAWTEVGLNITPGNSHRLSQNHRNTIEICRFAAPLLSGMDVGDDGTFPDFSSCQRHGSIPSLVKSRYTKQLAYAMAYIRDNVDLSTESVGFLKPRGGNWFEALKQMLRKHSYKYTEITRENEWPKGPENIALSTMYSAKGLEFDHVIILGLNDEVTPHGKDPGDSTLDNLRRLFAMAVTRARKSVMVGCKASEASGLIAFLDAGTYSEVCP